MESKKNAILLLLCSMFISTGLNILFLKEIVSVAVFYIGFALVIVCAIINTTMGNKKNKNNSKKDIPTFKSKALLLSIVVISIAWFVTNCMSLIRTI